MAAGRRRASAQSLQHPTGGAPLLCCCSGAKTQSLSALISQCLPQDVRASHLTPGLADGRAGTEARFLEVLEDDRAEIGAGQDFGGHTLIQAGVRSARCRESWMPHAKSAPTCGRISADINPCLAMCVCVVLVAVVGRRFNIHVFYSGGRALRNCVP